MGIPHIPRTPYYSKNQLPKLPINERGKFLWESPCDCSRRRLYILYVGTIVFNPPSSKFIVSILKPKFVKRKKILAILGSLTTEILFIIILTSTILSASFNLERSSKLVFKKNHQQFQHQQSVFQNLELYLYSLKMAHIFCTFIVTK